MRGNNVAAADAAAAASWIDRAALELYVTRCAARSAESMAELLRPSARVKVTPEYVERLAQLLEGMVRHYLDRAAVFGQNRYFDTADTKAAKRKRPAPMEVRESDFYFAWNNIMQDAME